VKPSFARDRSQLTALAGEIGGRASRLAGARAVVEAVRTGQPTPPMPQYDEPAADDEPTLAERFVQALGTNDPALLDEIYALRAVQRGTGLSARVVTAAALIMFSIFVAFMFTKDPTIKAIGFSFAAGVFLDAFVVRLTLVPAVMAIVRSKLWYHPEWFARYVPDPDIEGQRLEHQIAEGELATAGTAAREG
jgi:hypothetical protein